jgi:hypothetical protein
LKPFEANARAVAAPRPAELAVTKATFRGDSSIIVVRG